MCITEELSEITCLLDENYIRPCLCWLLCQRGIFQTCYTIYFSKVLLPGARTCRRGWPIPTYHFWQARTCVRVWSRRAGNSAAEDAENSRDRSFVPFQVQGIESRLWAEICLNIARSITSRRIISPECEKAQCASLSNVMNESFDACNYDYSHAFWKT